LNIKPISISVFASHLLASLVLFVGGLLFPETSYSLDSSVCATIKLEISQDVAFERQSFDAQLRIENGFPRLRLDDVDVKVFFTDEAGLPVAASSDPQNTDALFYIRQSSMQNIDDTNGTGIVQPLSRVDVRWIIIPSPGASNSDGAGSIYHVGARLGYSINGKAYTHEATPVEIQVKPMPIITLDYFLPENVYGDDAFTPEIEPSVPFIFGLRASNNGQGAVRNLQISTAQPKIIDNEQGLIANYVITSGDVDGKAVTPSFTVSLGDIGSNECAIARWIMTCSFSGRFSDFTAEYSHSDNLGGQLTSLIQGVATHTLVKDVLMEGSGKDGILDFLTIDNGTYTVLESQNTQTGVVDLSGSSELNGAWDEYALRCPASSGYIFVSLPDPLLGAKEVREVVRSDGKWIRGDNVWLSKRRNAQRQWEYFINLFDQDTTGSYRIVFGGAAQTEHAPVLQFIPDRTVLEGNQLTFLVEATDADGEIPSLYARYLPAGAEFVNHNNGKGSFSWHTHIGQAGAYTVVFGASDGKQEHTRQAVIRVLSQTNSSDDQNGNGIPDTWELAHFGNLDRDGTGDYDNDGISDLEEFLRGSDPTVANSAPTVPVIFSPANNTEITTQQTILTLEESTDPDGDPLYYSYELYADEGMTRLVANVAAIPSTSWILPVELNDNSLYYWRAQASDKFALTNWAYGSFFVNTANDAPTAPQIIASSEFDTCTPLLQITNSHDPDNDILSYTFEVYADSGLTDLVSSVSGVAQGQDGTTSWTVSTPLMNNTEYYWRVVVTDEHGLAAESDISSFLIHTENTAPSAPAINFPAVGSEITSTQVVLSVFNATDGEGDPLTYFFEIDRVNTFDSPGLVVFAEVTEQAVTTSCTIAELSDNTLYYWRVRAGDRMADSPWCTGSFFVNTANDAPSGPVLKNPADQAWVNTLTPILEIFPSSDVDRDAITYTFEVYADADLQTPVASTGTDACSWMMPVNLSDNTWYYWRVQARDEHGLASPWMQTARFFVNNDNIDDAPVLSFVQPGGDVNTNAESFEVIWDDQDPDSNAMISLYYAFDCSGTGGILIADSIQEDPDGEDDRYLWDLAGLADDTYYLYAVIADSTTSVIVTCPHKVTIDRIPPVVAANPPGGVYSTLQDITLSSNEPADIYYTLDGTEPTTASMMYHAPIQIDCDRTLKFMAVDYADNESAVVTAGYVIQSELIVTARTDSGSAISANWNVYVHRADGTATGGSAKTDADGIAHFDPQSFAAGSYKFRLSYMGSSFWSPIITVPETLVAEIVVEHETVHVEVGKTTGTIGAGASVYVFNDAGTIAWGIVGTTDAEGVATLSLPAGAGFRFRINYMGNTYWSDIYTVTSDVANDLSVNTGGGLVSLRVCWAPDSPLANLGTMLYDGTRVIYRGLSATTNTDGLVLYDIPEGSYSIRVSYQGGVFWTEPIQVSTNMDIDFVIPHEYVDVTVQAVYQGVATPWPDLSVYLYGENQTYYRGQVYQTDAQGKVTFVVPELASKAKASCLGRTCWSDTFTWQDISIDIPMAEAEVVVTSASQPVAGLTVYAYTAQQIWTNVSGTTDTEGKVRLRLPVGSYVFRATYLGNTYWTDASTIMQDTVNQVALSTGGGSFQLNVSGVNGAPLPGLNCDVYDSIGTTYLGRRGLTDSSGNVSFDLSSGDYRFLVRYMGAEYWSDAVSVPGTLSAQVLVAHEWVDVQVDKSTGHIAGADVYLFNGAGTMCWSVVDKTDADGVASFYLPVGLSFSFRANYMGSVYWSAPHTVTSGGINSVFVNAGGGLYQLTVLKKAGRPLPGLSAYLFDATGAVYRGITAVTDESGAAIFDVPAGTYSVRVDYQGGHFWTQPIELLADTAEVLVIQHQDVIVSVLGVFQGMPQPVSDLGVYLFSEQGVWRGQMHESNTSGRVTFNVPQLPNKARTSYLGRTYWSDMFTWKDAEVGIPMGRVEVTVTDNSQQVPGISIHVFSDQGADLGISGSTDAEGKVLFTLPAGSYLFNAYYGGVSHWSSVIILSADQVQQAGITN